MTERELRKGQKTTILRAELREFGFQVPEMVDVVSVRNRETGGMVSFLREEPDLGSEISVELFHALEEIAEAYGAKYDIWPHYAPRDPVIVWPTPHEGDSR